jgi:hypothetical protein
MLLLAAAFALTASAASALSLEAGGIGGGGLSFASGTFPSNWTAAVVELGASAVTSAGTVSEELFPGFTAGLYAELLVTDWLGVRIEPRWASMGFSRLASTDAGIAYERFGASVSAVLIPALARGYIEAGPGRATATLGPFLGFVAGPVGIVERYTDASTNLSLSAGAAFFGVSGGGGYELALGPGTLSLEARADWAITTMATDALGGTLSALNVAIMAGYGITIGGIFE